MSPDAHQPQSPMAAPQAANGPANLPAAAPVAAPSGYMPLPAGMPGQMAAPPAGPAAPAPAVVPVTPAAPGGPLQLQAAEQVNQLIAQYGSDPHRLSEALSRLRAGYVAQQYHITAGRAEGQ